MHYLGIFFISLATLTLEVLQMRLFSVTLWHHLAYMVITVALLGFGAAGSATAVWRQRFAPDQGVNKRLSQYAFAFSGLLFVTFVITMRLPLDTFQLLAPPPDMPSSMASFGKDRPAQLFYVFLYYLLLLPTYFFAGLAIAVSFTRSPARATSIYFVNLLGSALGCFAVVVLLRPLTGEGMIILVMALGLLSALFFALAEGAPGNRRLLVGVMAGLLAVLALLPSKNQLFPVRVASTKALGMFEAADPNLAHEWRQWDPVARIDVVSSEHSHLLYHMLPSLPTKIITIDGDAYTFLYSFPVPWQEYEPLSDSFYATAYWMNPTPRSVLAVGLGGGADIATALRHKPEKITGVEINAAMKAATGDIFREFSRDIYRQPGVNIVHEEGRSYIKRSGETYDIIQMSGVDTWSGLASGAYVLSENYLYTVDAVKEYLAHLNDDGVLCVVRFLFDPPRETLRFMSVAAQALKEMGVADPDRHMALLTIPFFGAMLIKRTPFTETEYQRLRDHVAAAKTEKPVKIVYAGLDGGDTQFHRFMRAFVAGGDMLENFYRHYRFDVTPVYDDKPFFFSYYKWQDAFSRSYGVGGPVESQYPVGLWILVLSLLQALALSALLIVAPLLRLRGGAATPSAVKQVWTPVALSLFAALGLAYMLIEIGLMQRMVLYLGHPSYSIAVTLATLLGFSGLGSWLSGLSRRRPAQMLPVSLGLAVLIGAIELFVVIPGMVSATLGLPLWARVLLTIVTLAPLGIVMGVPFPTAVRALGEERRHLVAWAWGVNGACSVVASVAAILAAMTWGFTTVLSIGLMLYFTALICAIAWRREES